VILLDIPASRGILPTPDLWSLACAVNAAAERRPLGVAKRIRDSLRGGAPTSNTAFEKTTVVRDRRPGTLRRRTEKPAKTCGSRHIALSGLRPLFRRRGRTRTAPPVSPSICRWGFCIAGRGHGETCSLSTPPMVFLPFPGSRGALCPSRCYGMTPRQRRRSRSLLGAGCSMCSFSIPTPDWRGPDSRWQALKWPYPRPWRKRRRRNGLHDARNTIRKPTPRGRSPRHKSSFLPPAPTPPGGGRGSRHTDGVSRNGEIQSSKSRRRSLRFSITRCTPTPSSRARQKPRAVRILPSRKRQASCAPLSHTVRPRRRSQIRPTPRRRADHE